MDANNISSTRIKGLQEAVLKGDGNAINVFWKDVEKNGTPLIENIPGDDKNLLVTLVWKDAGDIETIAVLGEMFGMDTAETKLERLLDTNLFYRTYKLPVNARSLYIFFVNEKPDMELSEIDHRLDPYNPHIVTCVNDEEHPGDYCILFKQESMIELPGFKNSPYVEIRAESAKGSIEQFTFESSILNRSKRVWLYKPANFDNMDKSCKLAIFLDGWEYLHETKTAVILDNMIAKGVIPPVAAVFVDNRDNRMEELRLNTVFIDFLAKEIVPWAKGKCNISEDPKDALIGGFSAGGHTAVYSTLLYPEVFGNVLSQSGAIYWGYDNDMDGAVVVNKYKQADKLPVDIFMTMGEFERFEIYEKTTRRFYNLLKDKGYRVKLEEFMGGHTCFDCQITLSKGLEFLLGKI